MRVSSKRMMPALHPFSARTLCQRAPKPTDTLLDILRRGKEEISPFSTVVLVVFLPHCLESLLGGTGRLIGSQKAFSCLSDSKSCASKRSMSGRSYAED
jgi:hypothetical protein